MAESLDPKLVEELYAETPDRFIAARTDLSARLKSDGDVQGAKDVAALRKPSVAAWAVNRVARDRSSDVETLIRLGANLAEAQRKVASEGCVDRLRDVGSERRRLVDRLVREASDALESGGMSAARATLDKVANTLMAIATDDDASERVRRGVLDKELPAPAGFGDDALDASLLASVTQLPSRSKVSEGSGLTPARSGKRGRPPGGTSAWRQRPRSWSAKPPASSAKRRRRRRPRPRPERGLIAPAVEPTTRAGAARPGTHPMLPRPAPGRATSRRCVRSRSDERLAACYRPMLGSRTADSLRWLTLRPYGAPRRFLERRRMKIRVRHSISLSLAALMFGFTIIAATPASASLVTTPDTTWMTNGQIRAVVVSGGYLYIGGKFTTVRQLPPGTPGGGSYNSTNLARIDLATGQGDPSWTPSVTTDLSGPAVFALAATGNQIWVGGSFTAVNGAPRLNLAAVSATTGAVDPAVAPLVGTSTADRVQALAAGPTFVYAGGFFTTVNGQERRHLAAFHTDGTLDATWRPRTDKRVFSMAMDCTGSTLFVGGQFLKASSSGGAYVAEDTLARFDLAAGTLHPWTVPAGTIPSGQKAYALAPTCSRLFVAYGGSNWASAMALDNGTTGNEVWRTTTTGNVQAIAFTGERVVIGGHFTRAGGTARLRIAALIPTTGAVDTTWNPGMDGNWGGPWAMAVEANHLWVGGEFKLVAGISQYYIARFTF